MGPRYVIGIDLGTSNSALSYIDLQAENPHSTILPISQQMSEDSVAELEVLPSFLHLPQIKRSQTESTPICGYLARELMSVHPEKVIHSAKSWLCHGGVSRSEAILPWGVDLDDIGRKFSPVEVSAQYLSHFRNCWDNTFGLLGAEHLFINQQVIITVPASFDEVSQQLTLEAAKQARFPAQTRLLEEPQAAFYFWLEQNNFGKNLEIAQSSLNFLVIDIGGGTTDFSFFSVNKNDNDLPEIVRIAVGEHLLLGGDNIDLTLAHIIESKLTSDTKRLSPKQWSYLVPRAREIKERVLGACADQELINLSIPGEGSSLFANSLSVSLERSELISFILEGFFPRCDSSDRPRLRAQGLTEWGLPYALDTAVTKHLAQFLRGRRVDAVLYTGGTLKAEPLRDRIQQALSSWQNSTLHILENPSYDLAVAHGAAFYAYLRQTKQQQISGGYAHAIYLEVETVEEQKKQLICALPRGAKENSSIRIENIQFELLADQPVCFQLYYSNSREDDQIGNLVEYNDEQFHSLPSIETMLSYDKKARFRGGSRVPVKLEFSLNEMGMLEMYCVEARGERPKKWQLGFNLRKKVEISETSQFDIGVDEKTFRKAQALIEEVYAKGKDQGDSGAKKLIKTLEEIFEIERKDWNIELLRALWPTVFSGMTRKGKSLIHEVTWLNLAGFLLRPGYGADLDRWRINELWRVFELGLAFPKENSALLQWSIMWRRVAGGLSIEQQQEVYIKAKAQMQRKGAAMAELYRLIGSLERIDEKEKREFGSLLVRKISEKRTSEVEDAIWALGRISSRVPLYAEADRVISPIVVANWFERLSALDWNDKLYQGLKAACSQAMRITGNRVRDIDEKVLLSMRQKMINSQASSDDLKLIEEYVPVAAEDQARLFGEALPSGLRINLNN